MATLTAKRNSRRKSKRQSPFISSFRLRTAVITQAWAANETFRVCADDAVLVPSFQTTEHWRASYRVRYSYRPPVVRASQRRRPGATDSWGSERTYLPLCAGRARTQRLHLIFLQRESADLEACFPCLALGRSASRPRSTSEGSFRVTRAGFCVVLVAVARTYRRWVAPSSEQHRGATLSERNLPGRRPKAKQRCACFLASVWSERGVDETVLCSLASRQLESPSPSTAESTGLQASQFSSSARAGAQVSSRARFLAYIPSYLPPWVTKGCNGVQHLLDKGSTRLCCPLPLFFL